MRWLACEATGATPCSRSGLPGSLDGTGRIRAIEWRANLVLAEGAGASWGVPVSRMPLQDDGPLSLRIPDDHPRREELERRCLAVLDDLGPGWRVTISSDGRYWQVSLRHPHTGAGQPALTNMRAFSLEPPEVERFLRRAGNQMKQEGGRRFGMTPVTMPTEEQQITLIDLVVLNGGRLHPDGWITLDDDKRWPAVIEKALEVGVVLAAAVR